MIRRFVVFMTAGMAAGVMVSVTLPMRAGAQADNSIATQARAYRSFSLPVLGADSSVTSVLSELGAYDPHIWRLYAWQPQAHAYAEAGTGFAQVARGLGYWLITRDAHTIHTSGTALGADTLDIPLSRGPGGAPAWNQLGNPFPYPLSVGNWSVVKRDTSALLGGASDIFTDHTAGVRVYQAPSYPIVTSVGMNDAFWLRVLDGDPASRWILWQPSADLGVQAASPAIAIGRAGNVHLAYNSTGLVYHAWRHGLRWQFETVDALSPAFSSLGASVSSLTLDSRGAPLLAYADRGGALHYAKKSGTSWTKAVVDASSGTNPHSTPSIAADPNDNGAIVFFDQSGVGAIRYAHWVSGSWTIEQVAGVADVTLAATPCLKFDSQGTAHVLYRGGADPTFYLYYATRGASAWSVENTNVPEKLGVGCQLAFAGDAPHVAFTNQTTGDVRYGHKIGAAWAFETVATAVGSGTPLGLALDTEGRPWIVYVKGGLLRCTHKEGASWVVEDAGAESASTTTTLAMMPDGTPWAAVDHATHSPVMIHERSPGTVHLRVAPVAAPAPTAAASTTKPAGVDWTISIQATQGVVSSQPLVLGSAAVPRGEWNALAIARIPAPPDAGGPELYVPRADWGRMSDDYVRDFQAPDASMSWPVMLSAAVAPGEVTLRFDGMDVPADARLWIEDRGERREVALGQSLPIEATGDPRHLVLTVTRGNEPPGDARPPREGFLHAYPNPFAQSAGLAFSLARRGVVRAEILDAQGRLVRTLARSDAPAGEPVLVWDGRDDRGAPLLSGMYFVRYRAGDSAGTIKLVKIE